MKDNLRVCQDLAHKPVGKARRTRGARPGSSVTENNNARVHSDNPNVQRRSNTQSMPKTIMQLAIYDNHTWTAYKPGKVVNGKPVQIKDGRDRGEE